MNNKKRFLLDFVRKQYLPYVREKYKLKSNIVDFFIVVLTGNLNLEWTTNLLGSLNLVPAQKKTIFPCIFKNILKI